MKVVILAGGLGTRLSEETNVLPKPMVEIGGRPILWHIMKIYSHYGFNDFIILSGYKSHVIKEFFINYYMRYSDVEIDLAANTVELHKTRTEPWKVTILYTGQNTMTGGRLLHAKDYLKDGRFLLTYGDGVADINLPALVQSHEQSGRTVTLTAVRPAGRFGVLNIDDSNAVTSFSEKTEGDNDWINGGFFVMEPAVFDYLQDGADTILERKPLETLAAEGRLNAYRHDGFWRPMDTLKDKNELTEMWVKEHAPWKVWE
jgi:glucose-1-phosphate cytidylyltransferase